MNIGLLGFGVVGRGVYDMLADRDDIRAAWVLCRRDLGELTAKTTYDIQDILSDPAVDTVVEVMGGLHPAYEYVAAALRAGKNVLCEKPAARTYAEALEMQKVQHETGKVLNIGVVNRFNDSVNLIKQFIDEGKLGEVFHVYVSFRAHRSIPGLGGAFTTKAIAGGGALIECRVSLNIEEYT